MSVIPPAIFGDSEVKRPEHSQWSCTCQNISLLVPCHTLLSSSLKSKLILAQWIFTALQPVKPQVHRASSWNSTAELSKHQTVKVGKSDTKEWRTTQPTQKSTSLHGGKTKDIQTNRCCLPYSLKAAEERDSLSRGYPVHVFSTICSISHFPRHLEELETRIFTSAHSSLAARILHALVQESGEWLPQNSNSVTVPTAAAQPSLKKSLLQMFNLHHHILLKKGTLSQKTIPVQGPASRAWAGGSGNSKACLLRSWVLKTSLILPGFIPKGRLLCPYRCGADTAVAYETSAQGNSALTKQGFYHDLVWKNESNQERFGAFKLRKRKKRVYLIVHPSLHDHWLHYSKTLPKFSSNTTGEITHT